MGSEILSLLLFIIALGVLVTIHELGHLIAAKSFKVYCSDFSIGFGPKIVNIKRKGHETAFKIGVLPLGGYVSMYGEGTELPEGVKIPRSRSLEGIARWKRFIIMSAGIVMNFILAYIIFFICASCFPQYKTSYINQIQIRNEETFAQKITILDTGKVIENDDYLAVGTFSLDKKVGFNLLGYYDGTNFKPGVHHNASTNKYYVFSLNTANAGIYDLDDYASLMTIYEASLVNGYLYETNKETSEQVIKEVNDYLPVLNNGTPVSYRILKDESFDDVTFSFKNKNNEIINAKVNISSKKEGVIDSFGFGVSYIKFWAKGQAFKIAGDNWITSTKLISKALGNLFVGKGWDQLGGPISIFTQTTTILENNPFNAYLQTWGIISVNLALFNLLPFPGLDGWHMLVTIIEGATNTIKRIFYYKKNPKISKSLLKAYEINENDLGILKTDFENKYKVSYETCLLDNTFSGDNSELDPKYIDFTGIKNKEDECEKFIKENKLEDTKPFKEWGLPEKVKNIVSYIGLALLFALMIAVFAMDIIRIV